MFQNLFQIPKLSKYAAASKKWLDLLGFDIRNVSIGDKTISCTISFPEKVTGNNGIIHGGMISFIIDSLAGIHAQMFFDKNGTVLTKNLSVDFLRPIAPNEVYMVSSQNHEGNVVVEISKENEVYTRGSVMIIIKS